MLRSVRMDDSVHFALSIRARFAIMRHNNPVADQRH